MNDEQCGSPLILSANGLTAEIAATGSGFVRIHAYEIAPREAWTSALTSAPELLPLDKTGELQIHPGPGGSFTVSKDGKPCFEAVEKPFDSCGGVIRFSFKVDRQEQIFGLGQDPMAKLNQNGRERRMWNQWGGHSRSGNMGLGFFSSSAGYGMLLTNTEDARFRFNESLPPELDPLGEAMVPSQWSESTPLPPNIGCVEVRGGFMELFVMAGTTLETMKSYYRLTGLPALLPKWAFGFMQCKNRYQNRAQLEAVAKRMREENIPCDTLIIDWLWFREFGDLEWREDDWPDANEMLTSLHQLGFHVMNAQHPFISERSKYYDFYNEKGFLNKVPDAKRITYDHTNHAAREHWWQKTKSLYEHGISGYWMDMGELEEHFDGTISHGGGRNETHNAYTLMWSQGIFEGQKRDFETRGALLVRSGSAGMQKYGTILWSGDIDASWQVLEEQVRVMQGVAMSGLPYWTTDIGGFLTHTDFSPELYVRWMEWGIFCTVFRTHGTRPENEPWSFGTEAQQKLESLIRLRYTLLPYIYSLGVRNAVRGDAIIIPMAAAYPGDELAAKFDGQYLFGPELLVAPVTEKRSRCKEVYLPEGRWYHWFSGKLYGQGVHSVPAPLGELPLFVRAGAILPVYTEIGRNTAECSGLTMLVFTGASGEAEFFDTPSDGFAYENGEYTHIRLTHDGSGEVKSEALCGDAPQYRIDLFKPVVKRPDFVLDCDQRGGRKVTVTLTCLRDRETSLTLQAPEGYRVASFGHETESLGEIYTKLYTDIWQGTATLSAGQSTSWELEAAGDFLPLEQCKVTVQAGSERLVTVFEGRCADHFAVAAGFPAEGEAPLDAVFEPETASEKPYYKYGDRRIIWQTDSLCTGDCFGYTDIRRFVTDVEGEELSGVAYLRENLYSEEECAAEFLMRHSCAAKLWLNGSQIHLKSGINGVVTPISLPLAKGNNLLLVKLACRVARPYSGSEYGFALKYVGHHKIWHGK